MHDATILGTGLCAEAWQVNSAAQRPRFTRIGASSLKRGYNHVLIAPQISGCHQYRLLYSGPFTSAMATAVFDPTDPTSPLSISPQETALLLIDYQNMLRGRMGEEAWTSVTNIASQLRDWGLSKNMHVVHCLIDTSHGARPPRHTKLSTKWKSYEAAFASAPELGREADILVPRGHSALETVVVRTPGFISALESYGLTEALRARGIRSLILGGISTSGCVLSTARAASDCGFIVTVVEDACFDPVPGLHSMLVRHVLSTNSHVATSWEIRDAWKVL